MTFNVLFHPEAAREIKCLERAVKERLKTAIAERLMTKPEVYGRPLRATLKGYWKLRVGDYRIVYTIHDADLIIYAVRHRKEVYRVVSGRVYPKTQP